MTDAERTPEEQRRYFRINDEVLVAWQVLSEEELAARREGALRARVENDSLRELMDQLDLRYERLREKLQDIDPAAREAMEILRRKVALLEGMMTRDRHRDDDASHQLAAANLSACGIALTLSRAVAPGTYMALDLILLPDYVQLELVGEVVNCEEAARGGHVVGLNFLDMREEDRDHIARHVARLQSELLRKQRSDKGTPDA